MQLCTIPDAGHAVRCFLQLQHVVQWWCLLWHSCAKAGALFVLLLVLTLGCRLPLVYLVIEVSIQP